jgi:hypothetical protein
LRLHHFTISPLHHLPFATREPIQAPIKFQVSYFKPQDLRISGRVGGDLGNIGKHWENLGTLRPIKAFSLVSPIVEEVAAVR